MNLPRLEHRFVFGRLSWPRPAPQQERPWTTSLRQWQPRPPRPSGKKGRSFWWRRWKIEQEKCQGFHSSVLCMTNVWCPFISTITTCLTWCGRENILFLACWNTSTSNPSKQQPLCWLLSSTKSAAAFRSAASSLYRDQLQLVATRYACFLPTIQISWWPMTGSMCYGTHLHQQPPLLFIFKGGAQLHLRLANWANCIWVLVDGEWRISIYISISRSRNRENILILEKRGLVDAHSSVGCQTPGPAWLSSSTRRRPVAPGKNNGGREDMELLNDAPKSWAKAGLTKDLSQESTVELQLQSVRTSKFCVWNASNIANLVIDSKNQEPKKNIAAPQGQFHPQNTGLDYPWFQLWEFSLGLEEGTLPHFAQFFDLWSNKITDSGGKIPEFENFRSVHQMWSLWSTDGRKAGKNVRM